jgi:hypothetical protein
MDASKALGVLALVLGLVGSIANGYASSRQLSGTTLNLTHEAAESAGAWSVRGWFLVGLAAVVGIVATLLG